MTAPVQDRPDLEGAPGEEYGLTAEITEQVVEALHAGDRVRVERLVDEHLYPADVADLIEQLGPDDRELFIAAMRRTLDPEVLPELDESIRDEVLALLGNEELAGAIKELDSDDALEIVADLDDEQLRDLLARLPLADRLALQQGLTYPEDTAGRLMQRELVAVPAFWTVGETIDYMRGSPDLPDDFYDLFVVDPAPPTGRHGAAEPHPAQPTAGHKSATSWTPDVTPLPVDHGPGGTGIRVPPAATWSPRRWSTRTAA